MARLHALVAGHVTHDRFGPHLRAGGALYCALVHQALGAQTRLVSAVGRDFACQAELEQLACDTRVGERTTCFVNVYPEDGPRQQRIEGIAPPVLPPPDERRWDVLHLAPVIGELELALWKPRVRARWIGINVQGWLREPAAPEDLSGGGREVQPRVWEPEPELLAGVGVACLSEEDLVQQTDLLARLLAAVPIVALTHGAQGSELFVSRKRFRVGAAPSRCSDPTGAGDAFAAALLQRVALGEDPVEAARFAAAVAALAIEAEATSGLKSLDLAQAEQRARQVRVEI